MAISGGRGMPEKPTALKLLHGNPGKRKINKNNPQFEQASIGPPPTYLRGEAKRLWKELQPKLDAVGLSSPAYRQMLEGLCVHYGRAKDADKLVRKEGLTCFTSTGGRRRHPAVAISNEAWRMVGQFCGDFGLSPLSNGKIVIKPPSPKSKLADALK